MLKHRRLFLSLALSALIGLIAGEASAGPISMTITIGGGPSLLLDPFATVGVVPGANTYNVDTPLGIAAVNAFLTANGSEYQFVSISGSSNFPGSAVQGTMGGTVEIKSVAAGGANAVLTLTETQSGFTSPLGPAGTLNSSSTGTFTNQAAGIGHTASSALDAMSTPTYSVLSSGTPTGTGGGSAVIPVAPVALGYTLTNVLTFGLSKPAPGGGDIKDSAGVTATVSAVPEPASLVMFMMGMPLPLVVVGLLVRRRRAAV